MTGPTIHLAGPRQAAAVARALLDFNREFDTPSPSLAELEERTRKLLAEGAIRVLLTGESPDGLALISFRHTVWSDGPAALLEELYVVPDLRGQGIGRALLQATLELARQAGCAWIEVCTGESDTAARGLYASFGFTNVEDSRDRPRMLYYERQL